MIDEVKGEDVGYDDRIKIGGVGYVRTGQLRSVGLVGDFKSDVLSEYTFHLLRRQVGQRICAFFMIQRVAEAVDQLDQARIVDVNGDVLAIFIQSGEMGTFWVKGYSS